MHQHRRRSKTTNETLFEPYFVVLSEALLLTLAIAAACNKETRNGKTALRAATSLGVSKRGFAYNVSSRARVFV
jgi:hypothetical protein